MPKSRRIKHRPGAPKSYLHRLPGALKALTELPTDRWLVGHEWISEHLGVSKATSIRILHAIGAEFYGNTLLGKGEQLYLYFHKLRQNPDAQPEMRRQSRTAATLVDMARYMSHRQTVVGESRQLTGSLLKTLSKTEGLSLTGSRLVIDFQGFEDFLRKFGMIVYALRNSLDEVRQFLDAPSRDP